jgi:hypothetical protein
MRQHNQIAAFAIWPRLASLPLGNVAAIAAEASAVIEIGTMRLIWSCRALSRFALANQRNPALASTDFAGVLAENRYPLFGQSCLRRRSITPRWQVLVEIAVRLAGLHVAVVVEK